MNPAPASDTARDDARFMRLALAQAEQGAQSGEVPIGAVVVRDGEVIASAHNAPISLHDPTAHAEVRALRLAAQALGNYRLERCTLYVTVEPCAMCSGAILHARLARVVFGADEPRTGAAGSVLDVLGSTLNHHTDIRRGVLAQECAATVQRFFNQRRLSQQRDRSPLREDALRTPEARFADIGAIAAWSQYANDWPSLRGWRVHWLDNRSDPSAAATLYLHGPQSWSVAHADALTQSQPAVALDWLGFGRSDKPKKEAAHTWELHAHVLSDALAHLNVAHIVAPTAVAPILARLPVPWQRIPVDWAAEPVISNAQAQAPYPDRGHEAARRAWLALASSAP